MNKHILTFATALALIFAGGGCDYNEDNFEGLQNGTVATDVKKFDYTLLDADYKTIATNSDNKTLASANGVSNQLKKVETDKFFTKQVSGRDYIPNFLAATYPTADDRSSINVTYNFYNEAVTCFKEDFENDKKGEVPAAWTNVVTNDSENSGSWKTNNYSENNFVECTAFKFGPTEVYLVSPAIKIDTDMTLTFKACYRFYQAAGGRLSVLISADLKGSITKESIAAASWKDITDQLSAFDQNGNLGEVCSYNMNDFAGKEVRIAFRYDGDGTDGANKTTTIRIDDIKIADAASEEEEGVVERTEQFTRKNNLWKFDPSIVWVIEYGKNKQPATDFFQACVDWVKANIENGTQYISSYGNNDYYSGASAYNGNLDWRVSAARGQYAAAFEGKTDEEVTKMLQERTAEVFTEVLPQFHPDFAPMEGVDVTLTVQCGVYDGAATVYYNFVFDVVAKGEYKFKEFAKAEE